MVPDTENIHIQSKRDNWLAIAIRKAEDSQPTKTFIIAIDVESVIAREWSRS